EFPLQEGGELFSAGQGIIRIDSETPVYASASSDSHNLAVAPADHIMQSLGTLGEWTRVDWRDGQFGWVPTASTSEANADLSAALAPVFVMQPPVVELTRTDLWTDQETFEVRGTIRDNVMVEDYYIWVYGQNDEEEHNRIKVTYEEASGTEVDFAQEVPLFPGSNRVAIIARDDEHMTSSESYYVFRAGPEDQVADGAAHTP
ncbi:MAG: hypothetical protein KC561_09560, partial [Myxococcales bacterium]|nr:hypothetical protein [Myxococcales bacterium]